MKTINDPDYITHDLVRRLGEWERNPGRTLEDGVKLAAEARAMLTDVERRLHELWQDTRWQE